MRCSQLVLLLIQMRFGFVGYMFTAAASVALVASNLVVSNEMSPKGKCSRLEAYRWYSLLGLELNTRTLGCLDRLNSSGNVDVA